MRIEFIKCHGSGNDFALVDGRALRLSDDDWEGVAVALSNREGPVGSDGLLLLTPGSDGHDFGMRMWNPDGSEAEACLNGLRCAARLGMDSAAFMTARIRLQKSSAEVARIDDMAPGVATIREEVGPADLQLSYWPMNIGQDELVEEATDRLPSPRAFTAIAMPNPHLIAFVEQVDDGELSEIGTFCEHRPRVLPNRANVSFVEQLSPTALFVRTFERGVGLTNACGSAMAASTYAACLTDRVEYDTRVTVVNAGGRVIATADGGGMVTLEGNATFEWRGAIEVDTAREETVGPLEIIERWPAEVEAWAAVTAMAPPAREALPTRFSEAQAEDGDDGEVATGTTAKPRGLVDWGGFSAVTPGTMARKERGE